MITNKENHYPSTDYFFTKYPVSIKGIITIGKQIVLLKNEREEWELPGGKLEENETVEACLIREVKEELCIEVTVNHIVDAWLYNINERVNVLIVSYYCNSPEIDTRDIKISHEHNEVGLFTLNEINDLNMPKGYKNSINAIKKHLT